MAPRIFHHSTKRQYSASSPGRFILSLQPSVPTAWVPEKFTERPNTLCDQNLDTVYVKVGGTYSYHYVGPGPHKHRHECRYALRTEGFMVSV